jgi:hypothetical protein
MKARAIKRAGAAAASIAVLLPALTGCGSSGNDKSSATQQSGTNTFPQSSEPSNLNPADFTTNIDNPYWPMPVGRSWHVHVTNPQGESLQETITVENQTKKIADGVTARVVRSRVTSHTGKLVERTEEWFAQDRAGNVWYFGEDTTSYATGRPDKEGSFEAGRNAAQPGVQTPARPRRGLRYRLEGGYRTGAADHSEVLSVGREQVEVPFRHFRRTLMTRDYSPLEPDVGELWFYAKGVGGVLALDISGGDHREELVSFRRG